MTSIKRNWLILQDSVYSSSGEHVINVLRDGYSTDSTNTSFEPSASTPVSALGGWKKSDPKFEEPGNGGGSAGKGDGDGVGNGAKQGKVKTPSAGNYYLTVGRSGVWQEDAATANGILDNGEVLLSVDRFIKNTADPYYSISGINPSNDNLVVRFVDATTPKPLDLSGFGSGDKVIFDGATNISNFYGMTNAWNGNAASAPTQFRSGTPSLPLVAAKYNFTPNKWLEATIFFTYFKSGISGYAYLRSGGRATSSSTVRLAKVSYFVTSGYAFEYIIPA